MKLDELLKDLNITTYQSAKKEILAKYNLNWEVHKQPMLIQTPTGVKETDYFGLVRTDNNKVLGIAKSGYVPFQNERLLELVNKAADKVGLSVTNGGSFKGGALVYLQIETQSIRLGTDNDKIRNFITAVNSHDGSLALKWGISNLAISCSNSFWAIAKRLQQSARHTPMMKYKVESILRDIERSEFELQELNANLKKFSEAEIDRDTIRTLAMKALAITDIDNVRNKERVELLEQTMAMEMKQKGETMWGAFSGVTFFTTHYIKGKDASKLVGSAQNIDHRAYNYLLELVN